MQQRKTATFTYNLIRASRKTISLKIEDTGAITVRAPLRMALRDIDRFVEDYRAWILSHQAASAERRAAKRTYTEAEREEGKRLARNVLTAKCRAFAGLMGVSYGTISVREQKTRWGSCSAKGNLNFNWKLVLMPEEILDYVVVHELAHRKHMNHSAAFWAEVGNIIPDYPARRAWLKEHGGAY